MFFARSYLIYKINNLFYLISKEEDPIRSMIYHIPIGETASNTMQTHSIYYPSPLTLRITVIYYG
ncbi:unnamed protein product [marine sediment metagenome]|uniref:Uncharacterized protein n=1 Tax=marine sediment metagenome TaxID=412755 RepID=X1CDD1_9ZZZZ